MPKTTSKKQSSGRLALYVLATLSLIFIVIGALASWAHIFIGDMVRTELSAQKIYFPEKGSAALDPKVYPDLQKYAGQLVDTPEEAKAYANGYIARHLQKVAGGKVYSEVSALSMKDPSNQALQQQKATLFQGETLRGILLTSGYGFGTVGVIAGYAAYVSFILGVIFLTSAIALGLRR